MRTLRRPPALPWSSLAVATLAVASAACGGGNATETETSGGGSVPKSAVETTGAATGAGGGSGGSGGGPAVPACVTDADCADAAMPLCDAASGACSPLPPGHELGFREGGAGVAFTLIHQPEKVLGPSDLEFHPDRPNELWVVNRKDNSVHIVFDPGTPAMTSLYKRDPAASHFMPKPPAIAFGAHDTFGVCGDSDNGGNDFMGPALFPADLEIFAKATPGGLGSHLDMLHSTTFCRGIAHEVDNVYWVFNSNKGSLDRYDFVEDHGPGNDDHADGKIWRYVPGQVAGVTGVSSHLAYDAATGLLYVADTGNGRIAALDTKSGTEGASFPGLEPAMRRHVDGATIVDVVPPGALQKPSGLALRGGVLFVSDNATGVLHAFDTAGKLLRTLDTNTGPDALAGITIGPDGRLYFVDSKTAIVWRIDPS